MYIYSNVYRYIVRYQVAVEVLAGQLEALGGAGEELLGLRAVLDAII